jgi:hypothetical protein
VVFKNAIKIEGKIETAKLVKVTYVGKLRESGFVISINTRKRADG